MSQSSNEAVWRKYLRGEASIAHQELHLLGLIPANPRCKVCHSPFGGFGGRLMKLMGRRPWHKNPLICDTCSTFMEKYPGGAEVELTMLFVDARGSTALAEKMSASEFSQLLNRFYAAATDVLIKADAMIDKLVGDEVIGLFIPGFTGPHHARLAVQAAQTLLRVTGHDDPNGPWLPVGVGVHTGVAFVGTVSGTSGAVNDLTALGDNVNITARLASKAGAGEALISEATYAAAGLNFGELERRQLELKGKSEPVGVRVLQVGSVVIEAK
jgi:adenylate cyclase